MYRIGIGYDTHRLVQDRPLIIGGINIPFFKGLLGHSDGDVLLHAISDAILGAAGFDDIGHFFPDTNPSLKGMSSKIIVTEVFKKVSKKFEVVNIDSVVVCEAPRLSPYTESIKQNISQLLHCNQIGVKATTAEKMNAEGSGEGITAHAVCMLKKIS